MLISFTWYFQPDEDLFNPDYVEVDRVLDVAVTTDTETGEVGIEKRFFILMGSIWLNKG